MNKTKLLCVLAGLGLGSTILAPVIAKEVKNGFTHRVPDAGFNLPSELTGMAIGINNKTGVAMKYWYSSKELNPQARWYQHSIQNKKHTWDWAWAQWNTRWGIELQWYDLNINQYIYCVVTYHTYVSNVYQAQYYLSWTTSPVELSNPSWNENIWNQKIWWANYYNTGVWHLEFDINSNGIYDNSYSQDHQWIFQI